MQTNWVFILYPVRGNNIKILDMDGKSLEMKILDVSKKIKNDEVMIYKWYFLSIFLRAFLNVLD